MSLKKIMIDGQEIEVPGNLALIQACEEAGVEVPRFCYHERLSVAGNCRMCLVEVKGAPKPMASCAVTVNDLRGGPNGEPAVVLTQSPLVKKAREGVMEFLLANHPLDCPICDQGGECDLQDQAMAYGGDRTRFDFGKRAVEDKNLGPLVKTVMTRCIYCTRCVRFSTEIAGSPELGAIYRGEETEITPYLENIVTSELSANIIDLCPVGALTSKPYAFTARPWEMKKIESYDITDAMGSAITIQSRGNTVMRITPRNDDDVNEEWISNKARFVVDGLNCQRLDKPYIRKDGKLTPVSWDEALEKTAEILNKAGENTAFLAGRQTDIETLYAAKMLAQLMNAHTEGRISDSLPVDNIALSRYNATFVATDYADAILLVGTNPRFEASVLNARIRKSWLHNDAKVALIGEAVDLTYDYTHLGNGADAVGALLAGHDFAKILADARNPLIIIGEGAVSADGADIFAQIQNIMDKYNIRSNALCFLTSAMSLGGVMELGFADKNGLQGIYESAQNGTLQAVVSLASDDVDFTQFDLAQKIYVGSHGDNGAHYADVILPAAGYTEKDSLYITSEGRVRYMARAVFPVGDAKEDWAILRALSEIMDKKLPFDSFLQLRQAIFAEFNDLNTADTLIIHEIQKIDVAKNLSSGLYSTHIKEFYMTDPACRASKTLHSCQRAFYGKDSLIDNNKKVA